MTSPAAKLLEQFYTPQDVARSLVRCVARSGTDRLLDPSCGAGQFLGLHRNMVGMAVSASSCAAARTSGAYATVHEGDFFTWAEQVGGRHVLHFDRAAEDLRGLTIIGGLKSKMFDIVVCKQGIGPVVCVSVKGTGNAFRSLTNRMEEAIGDFTNLHVMYPGLVYGFLHLVRGNRSG